MEGRAATMHELSLAMSILEICENEADRSGFRRIEKIILEIGTLSGVSIPALLFSFEEAARGTVAASAVLEINEPPGVGWCVFCDRSVQVCEPLRACPSCGRTGIIPTGGTELRLRELVVGNETG